MAGGGGGRHRRTGSKVEGNMDEPGLRLCPGRDAVGLNYEIVLPTDVAESIVD